jgi:hypothetical protein
MKASTLDVRTAGPSLVKVITRLTLLGGFILGGLYGLLELCASLIRNLH